MYVINAGLRNTPIMFINKIFVIFFCTFFYSYVFGEEIIGKALRCETDRETMRGYPFYFYFENSKNTQAYFIQSNEIKYHNKDFEEINSNLLEIQHIGTIDKDSLIMTHNKGLRKYNCSYLSSKKQILIELNKFL